MDMYTRLKTFLGLSPNTNDSEPSNRTPLNSFSDEEDRRVQIPRIGPNHYDSFGFNVFSSPLEMHRYFEHQMNEMLKNFGVFGNEDTFFGNFGDNSDPFFGQNPFGHSDFGSFQFPSSDDINKENSLKGSNLRDQHLKPGYESIPSGQPKIDDDVDEKFNMNELDAVLKEKSAPAQGMPNRFFHGQMFSSKTVRRPDGVFEFQQTIRDHNGNEESTITKHIDGKEYTVTIKKNKDGIKEIIENIDENSDLFLKSDKKKLENRPNDFPYDKFFE